MLLIKKFTSLFSLSSLIILSSLLISSAQATTSSSMIDNLKTVGGQSYNANTDGDTLINNIAALIKTALGLLGFIFVVQTIYAGFLWMTAGGNENNVKKAKGIMTNAVIGLIIVVSAYAVTWFIFANLPGGGAGPA